MFSIFRIFSRFLDNDNDPEPVDIAERQRQHANRAHWSEQNAPKGRRKNENRSAPTALGQTMSDEALTRFIISRFAQHDHPNEVIRVTAIEANISWSQAQAAVRRVYKTHRREIARKQAPLFIAIGLVTFIVGTTMTMGAAYATIKGVIIILFALPIPYSGNLLLFGVGLAMMTGSLYGMFRRRG